MPHFRLPRFHCSSSSTASTPWLPLPQYQPNPVSTNPSHQRTQRYTHRHAHLFSLAASLRVPPLLFSSLLLSVASEIRRHKRKESKRLCLIKNRRGESKSAAFYRFASIPSAATAGTATTTTPRGLPSSDGTATEAAPPRWVLWR